MTNTLTAWHKLAFVLLAFVFLAASKVALADSICTANFFTTTSATSTDLEIDTQHRAEAAAGWVYSMTDPLQVLFSDQSYTAKFDSLYAYSHTGEVSGTFTVNSREETVSYSAPLSLTSPSVVDAGYRGVVSGVVHEVSTYQGTHEVRALLEINGVEYDQNVYVVPSNIFSDGTWSVNLSSVPTSVTGEWRFAIFNSETVTQVGDSAPTNDSYENLVLELYVQTGNDEELVTTMQAPTSGEFSFNSSAVGSKIVYLKNNTNNTNLAKANTGSGLVRSYLVSGGLEGSSVSIYTDSYLYDQALAISMAIALGDDEEARALTEALLLTQRSSGAFPYVVPQLSPQKEDVYIRTKTHAQIMFALLQYIQEYPSDVLTPDVTVAANNGFNYINSLKITTGTMAGLYTGGEGRVTNGVVEEDYEISWAQTEDNILLWQVYSLAHKALDLSVNTYQVAAQELEQVILNLLWDTENFVLLQGYSPVGPDTAQNSGMLTLGAQFMVAMGEYQKAEYLLEELQNYNITHKGASGYALYTIQGGYISAVPSVSLAHSSQAALAYLRAGLYDTYQLTLNLAGISQESYGAFSNATEALANYEVFTYPSVGASAWFALASVGRDDIWNTCHAQPVGPSISVNKGNSGDQFETPTYEEEEEEVIEEDQFEINGVCRDKDALNYEEEGDNDARACIYFDDDPRILEVSETTLCSPYLNDFIGIGKNNDPNEVAKLEKFLQVFQNESIESDGVYTEEDVEAVKRFQEKYQQEILGIWGLTQATGYVGMTTRLKINSFYCSQKVSCPFFVEYNSSFKNFNTVEVHQTKQLLSDMGFFTGTVNAIYDNSLFKAMVRFQETFAATMLRPWGLSRGTGYKYKTTNKFLNYLVGCETDPINLEGRGVYSYTNYNSFVSATSPVSSNVLKKSCELNNKTIAHGASTNAYESSVVSAGGTCNSQTRTCSDGVLSGSFSEKSCSVALAAD